MEKILEVKNLEQRFDLNKGILDKIKFKNGKFIKEERIVNAVNNISFSIDKGKVFSLVGESGCGKSTTARTIIKLIDPKGGNIRFDGKDITNLTGNEMLKYRKKMQMIFQDPYASLNPRQRVLDILTEPMLFHQVVSSKSEAMEKAFEILKKVGIRSEQATRYPHQFSGGQRQRIGIARALAVEPEFIIADEPVSALDVSIQAQILNLMMDLKEEYNFSYLFIAHDLSVVKHISDDLGVMYLGKIVEKGSKKHIFNNPLHPYTKALFSAVPKLSGTNLKNSKNVQGEIPSAINLPSGCYFHERCPYAKPICSKEMPIEKEVEKGHCVLCHQY
ncbi:ABC transporter ATP-binding protein [Paramaledivibacter caminithermalis]|jgi:oligopeptide/dipeptide ABC transporter ATP-binding protein|uniref:Peptide/nickel transport system ATP-binding protein n=1 Tax=Paramaledivibacter caminithermalis (strain DSM 15212 / CIP 107654 / DViRD3) TaxID=1121301 RepID=A0A1M6P057_PARC5|nr:oligopeptide/dipeptide ABC transporter ATP-binding protein [Paramaledivibacter caminithermalis]SHK01298.1 peptide/nickel transport system ATP-binding protein [Paramaledivibacter caminithermalis DSM 15212]